ncbi:hypothetical protein MAR_027025, partial [Mya arenaria]
KDVLCVSLYNPPPSSPFYDDKACNGLVEFESLLCNSECKLQRYDLMLCGDLNARTDRYSKDTTVNTYGKLLLQLCISYSLCIINGRIGDDK